MTRPIVRFARPLYDKTEEQAIAAVMKAARQADTKPITNGGQVMAFEEKFSNLTGGVAVAVNSCFSALYLCLLARGIKRGDIVIMPALTHLALPHAVEMLGARCHFVDSHISSGNLDPDLLDPPLHSKIISVTHFLGQPAYMGSTSDIARRHGLEILEDCALALGSFHSGRHVGCIGFAGCFSFYPCKHITTGEGGMVVTRDYELAEKIKKSRSFGYGSDRDAGADCLGGNFRMTEFQAALGVAQIAKLRFIVQQREENLAVLRENLIDFQTIGGNYALSVFVGPKRNEIKAEMERRGIQCSIYYPLPVHRQPYYLNKYPGLRYPVAEKISSETITLSVGPHLTPDKMKIQAKMLRDCVQACS